MMSTCQRQSRRFQAESGPFWAQAPLLKSAKRRLSSAARVWTTRPAKPIKSQGVTDLREPHCRGNFRKRFNGGIAQKKNRQDKNNRDRQTNRRNEYKDLEKLCKEPARQ